MVLIKIVTLLALIGATIVFAIELRQEKSWFITVLNVTAMIVLGLTVLAV
jgi:hypothetical protein